jgi:uncharacterized protein (TIGR02145 family)
MNKNFLNGSSRLRYLGVVILIVSAIIQLGCSKDSSPGPEPQPDPTPIFSTKDVSCITATTALGVGRLLFDKNLVVSSFGMCYSTNEVPTLADNRIEHGIIMVPNWDFIIPITSLTPNTKYYVRTYMTDYDDNTSYGDIVSFTSLAYTDSVIDFDSNIYHAVTIGTQVWTVENLKVTHYRNGDPIPHITDGSQWDNLTTGAYCNYDNNSNYVATYGQLYNWYAIDDNRNIAPDGWHIPNINEWQTLIDFLGGTDSAGIKMMEPGAEHWHWSMSNPPQSTNESGFLALPGGQRMHNFNYHSQGDYTAFWSTTAYGSDAAWKCELVFEGAICDYLSDKRTGLSVRLIKD